MKEKTIILYGGKSVEHDISIITALQVQKALSGFDEFLPIYIDKSGIWWTAENLSEQSIYANFNKFAKKKSQVSFLLGRNILLKKKGGKFVEFASISAVLNCCHGNVGEDGAVAGILKACDIPHTSASTLAASLCMDKGLFKDVLVANDIPTPEYVYFDRENIKTNKIKLPVVVKPCSLGSSIGVSKCTKASELSMALDLAFNFDRRVIIEKLVENLREFNCACLKYKDEFLLSKVTEVENDGKIFSFEDKYLSNASKNKEMFSNLARKIKNLTLKVYKLFSLSGIVRVDFLYDEKKNVLYVNEVNTVPGSLAFYLFKDFSLKDLVFAALEQCKIDKNKDDKLVKTFTSDAIEFFSKNTPTSKK